MCYMLKSSAVLAIIPATVLLTISFFVLFATTKLNVGGLKTFGKILIALLWICALGVLLIAASPESRGRCAMDKMQMHKMMKQRMGCPMMQDQGMPNDQMMAH